MMTYYIHAKKFFLVNKTEDEGYLEIRSDGKFGFYYPATQKPTGKIVDYADKWVAPGLVDTHIHGLLGEDVMKSDFDGINKISNGLLKAGVTSFLPTTITASDQVLTRICQMFHDHLGQANGAKIQGLHFEGPFFTAEHAGAENPKYMTDPDLAKFEKWQKIAGGMIKKISLAPERKNACDFINQVTQSGVVVSLGHSSASYQAALSAVEAGASMFTHLFNGMPDPNHHHPNLANAAFDLNHIYAELICDGHHVTRSQLKMAIKSLGTNHIALITDCMEAGMMPEGDYMLGELPVYVKNNTARLKQGDNLAGSVLKLNQAVKNLVDWQIATPQEAIMMASYVPAKSAKILDKCGMIKINQPADFLILQPDLTLEKTYVDGKLRYSA